MSLTELFVERPTLVFVLIALMSFAGIVSGRSLVQAVVSERDAADDLDRRAVQRRAVTVMRDNIVSPIEQALAGTTDLQTINSIVQQGQATISAVYTINSDLATDSRSRRRPSSRRRKICRRT